VSPKTTKIFWRWQTLEDLFFPSSLNKPRCERAKAAQSLHLGFVLQVGSPQNGSLPSLQRVKIANLKGFPLLRAGVQNLLPELLSEWCLKDCMWMFCVQPGPFYDSMSHPAWVTFASRSVLMQSSLPSSDSIWWWAFSHGMFPHCQIQAPMVSDLFCKWVFLKYAGLSLFPFWILSLWTAKMFRPDKGKE